jgi:hypothetical protein
MGSRRGRYNLKNVSINKPGIGVLALTAGTLGLALLSRHEVNLLDRTTDPVEQARLTQIVSMEQNASILTSMATAVVAYSLLRKEHERKEKGEEE